ncbi:non-ribosomal peptide synthetase [Amycolatopsis magusensis]|uniref:Amino acid adenylation domain-containing protein n=1 Tax=Amycolatopsis magusensis TaxID=882444 RepID=A0ABS4PVY1_9PSEU|nr:non-ribosomal peptide synthetase [Amycolatopsis magusensis]MBP2183588.1 amino acid adenylation domain-containing protein [Amycolatopsis magusensis]
MTTGELGAELLRRLTRRTDRAATITPADRSRPLPLSYGQAQLWFLNRLAPDSAEYLLPMAVRLRGRLDEAGLGAALEGIVARHEILRTRYVLDGTEPVQVIDPPGAPVLSTVDAAEAGELVAAEAARGFDLAREWPVRAKLIRLGADDHVLAVTFHHIAADAWSVEQFWRELRAAYETSPVQPPEVQYADFANWQRGQASGATGDRDLEHWRERLAGLEPVELGTDRPRAAVREFAGADVEVPLPGELGERIRRLALRHRATPFMVALTAFQVLLARHTGAADIAVGTVLSGRVLPELRRMIGYGINSLVIRSDCAGERAFGELLDSVRAAVLDAHDHQAVPFARLVDELRPERDLARTPLFQTAVTGHGDREPELGLGELRVEPFGSGQPIAKFDLTLRVYDGSDGSLGLLLNYATALFDERTARRFGRHLVRLLDHATRDEWSPIGALDLLDAGELPVGRAIPGHQVTRCPHEVFEDRACRTPDAVAVVAGEETLTYAELDARANRVAHHLLSVGVGPETLVGVCLPRGPELVPALLGVLKAGAAYVPLDPANPERRLAMIAAGLDLVLTGPGTGDLGFHSGRTLVLGEGYGAFPDGNPGVPVDPDQLMYVIYTSGSTGRPNGVCLSHANAARLMTALEPELAPGPADVWTMAHSYAFDFSVFEMWGALLHGGTLVVVPPEVTRSPRDLLALLVEQRVTVLSQTPSAFRTLAAAATGTEALSLRSVVFGGEKLEVADLRPWADRFGHDRPALLNMYGITETTVHTTVHRMTAVDLAGSPIGTALSDLDVYLLDAAGRPVPWGAAGEIHVAGPGLARGYLGRADLTAARFVPDPFGPPGARMYRSGDLARRRARGLEFLGRADDQVKVRGYRIEPGEIAAALVDHPGVAEAVVVVKDGALVGYHVGGEVPPAELRRHLADRLPEYMLPARFVALERLPLTPNGKLDHRALPEPDATAVASRAYRAPGTPAELRIAEVWSSVLGVSPVGADDGFFDLGGDSIRAVAVAGALHAAGFRLTVRDIFDHRTVARLAAHAAGLGPAPETVLVAPFALLTDADRALLPPGVTDAYPMSQAQTGMVLEMLADDEVNYYHNVTSHRIRDDRPVDRSALRAAADFLVRRHEVLRTSLHLDTYSVPMQLVHDTASLAFSFGDVRGLGEPERDEVLRATVAAERASLFDLAVPGLLRFVVHETGDDGWWLTITECHPILEGWSYHSLLMELVRAYRAIRADREPPSPARPAVRYADFIAAELESLRSAEDRAYWTSITERYRPVPLPFGWGAGGDAVARANYAACRTSDLETGLRALATAADASLKSVLLAAHLAVLSLFGDGEPFHTGLVCDARPELPGADEVLGMYLNTLPFAHEPGAATWRELVARVFAREVELWAHRRFPRPEIQRLAGGGPLVRVHFNYQDFRQVDDDLVATDTGLRTDSRTENALTVASRGGYVVLTGDPRYFVQANLDELAGVYRAVLEAMAADPDGDAGTRYLTAEHRDRYLVSVEQVLAEADGVSRAAVLAEDEHVVGYAVLDDHDLKPDALWQHVDERLPAHLRPTTFMVLDELPADRRLLPRPEHGTAARTDHVAPRNAVERQLAELFCRVLGLGEVGVHEGFYDLGGDSMSAIALIGALRAAGLGFDLRDVLSGRSVAELAERIGIGERARPVAPFALLSEDDRARIPAGITDAYPLTQGQAGMVVEALAGADTPRYHIVGSSRIVDRPLVPDALRRTYEVLISRHETLRTSIELDACSVPVQLVHASAEPPVGYTDLSELDEAAQERALREFLDHERNTPFDLERAPLFRVFAHRFGERGWQLTISQHHAVMDGWSSRLLAKELLELYDLFCRGQEPPARAPAPARYADVVAAELRALASDEHREFWQRLAGVPKLELPAAWGAGAAARPYRVDLSIADLTPGLEALAAEARVPVKSVVLAAHFAVLGALTIAPSFHSGLTFHVRPGLDGADRVHGMHLNVLPIVIERRAEPWTGLIAEVAAAELATWPHRFFPMAAVGREVGGERRLVDVYFSYQDFGRVVVDEPGRIAPEESVAGSNEFPLNVIGNASGLSLRTNTGALRPAEAHRLAEMYRAAFEAMLADPGARWDLADLLPAGERHDLLVLWNSSVVETRPPS